MQLQIAFNDSQTMLIPKLILDFFGIEVDTETEKKNKESAKRPKKGSIKLEIPVKGPEDIIDSEKPSGKLRIKAAENKSDFNKTPLQDTTELISVSKKAYPIQLSQQTGFSIDIEKISKRGEDAPPIFISFDDNSHVIGVADGLGGAGGTLYEIENTKRSGAYIASRAINSI